MPRTLAEQLRPAKPDTSAAAGELEIRTKSPEGAVSVRHCWGYVTSAQLADIIKFVEKTTEGNRS